MSSFKSITAKNIFDIKKMMNKIMPAEKTLSTVHHALKKGESVHLHVEDVDEWIIVLKGKFTLLLEGELPHDIMETEWDLDGSEAMAFFLPLGKKHGLRAESALNYIVIKK